MVRLTQALKFQGKTLVQWIVKGNKTFFDLDAVLVDPRAYIENMCLVIHMSKGYLFNAQILSNIISSIVNILEGTCTIT